MRQQVKYDPKLKVPNLVKVNNSSPNKSMVNNPPNSLVKATRNSTFQDRLNQVKAINKTPTKIIQSQFVNLRKS